MQNIGKLQTAKVYFFTMWLYKEAAQSGFEQPYTCRNLLKHICLWLLPPYV